MITDNPIILNWISGYQIPFQSKPTSKAFRHQNFSRLEANLIRKEIFSLASIGAISKIRITKRHFVSPIFLISRSNGKKRFILNLKRLNAFIAPPHFKIEDMRTATKLISKNCFMSTIDLKDAYLMVPIHKKFRRFLSFCFENTYWQFNCLPFGLSIAPYIFTKIMKPVTTHLRSKGIDCVSYLDDFLIIGSSYPDCYNKCMFTINVLQSLGFLINFDKTSFSPSNECKYLGFIINSDRLQISLPPEKKLRITKMISDFRNQRYCSIKRFACLVGVLVSACPAIKYGWLHTKLFEKVKLRALRRSNFKFSKEMVIPPLIFKDLDWWLENVNNSFNNIRFDKYDLEIFSDASPNGWGVFCNNNKSHGWWDNAQSREHINVLELWAAYFALRIFASNKRSINILLRIDNTTAIACINRMGSVRFNRLHKVVSLIWNFCEERDLWIFASYISSRDNFEADAESRIVPTESEWELSDSAFQTIINTFGRPQIDLFATYANKKCNTFISWHRDPFAEGVDAFTMSWTRFNFYAFPPFSLILRTLRKIITDQALGIVVVPLWPSQAWFPMFLKLLISKPLILGPETNLLSSFFRCSHPLASDLILVAGKLSGRHMSLKASHRKA